MVAGSLPCKVFPGVNGKMGGCGYVRRGAAHQRAELMLVSEADAMVILLYIKFFIFFRSSYWFIINSFLTIVTVDRNIILKKGLFVNRMSKQNEIFLILGHAIGPNTCKRMHPMLAVGSNSCNQKHPVLAVGPNSCNLRRPVLAIGPNSCNRRRSVLAIGPNSCNRMHPVLER